ncbi:MAG: hypothetical protein M9928_03090 [Anaerolineae bacterium]|nr:hypothetical protein [Anaerolineae bacterium]
MKTVAKLLAMATASIMAGIVGTIIAATILGYVYCQKYPSYDCGQAALFCWPLCFLLPLIIFGILLISFRNHIRE